MWLVGFATTMYPYQHLPRRETRGVAGRIASEAQTVESHGFLRGRSSWKLSQESRQSAYFARVIPSSVSPCNRPAQQRMPCILPGLPASPVATARHHWF